MKRTRPVPSLAALLRMSTAAVAGRFHGCESLDYIMCPGRSGILAPPIRG